MVIVVTPVWIESRRLDGDLAHQFGLANLLEEYQAVSCSPVQLEFMSGARKKDREHHHPRRQSVGQPVAVNRSR